MFACPNCQAGLVCSRADGEPFWSCTKCGGRAVWFSWLRKQGAQELIAELWSPAHEAKGEYKRPCPLCGKLMLSVPTPLAAKALPLDLCKPCQLVWFNPTEYEEVVNEYAQRDEEKEGSEPLLDHTWKWLPALMGWPVERRSPRMLDRPWLTWGLAATIIAVSFAAFSNLPAAVQRFGMVPAQWWRYGGLTLLTSFFLHGGLLHLLGNVYFLLVFGDNVEDYLGRARYLALILLATVVGDLLHTAFNLHSQVASIGASGGISGAIVFYGLEFPRARLMVLILLFRPLRIRARTALILWILLQVLGAYEQMAGFTQVSALAHLGGAGVGLLFWQIFGKD